MDVFAVLFILSFIALIITLVVMSIYKRINKGKGDFKQKVETAVTNISWDLASDSDYSVKSRYKQTENGVEFVDCAWSDESWMKREVSEIQEKWRETVPKHSTRIKLRAYRKLRNKCKGHSKGVRGKKK